MEPRIEDGSPEIMVVAKALTDDGFAKQVPALRRISESNQRCFADPANQVLFLRFPLDQCLPAVQKVYDPGVQNRVLRRVVGAAKPWLFESLHRLAYKPERRFVCLVRGLDGIDRIVKFHAKDRFAEAVTRLRMLEQAKVASPKIVNVSSRYQAVCLEYLSGSPLGDLLASESDCSGVLAEVGSALARLHASAVNSCWLSLPMRRFQRLTELSDSLGVLSSDLGCLAGEIVKQVIRRFEATGRSIALCHGDFYCKQVLVDHGGVRFIDFDQVGPADRYADIANFVAQLYWRRLNGDRGLNCVREFCEVFLDGYRRVSGHFDDDRFRVQLAGALLSCSMHPFRNALPNWEEGVEDLLQKARSAITSPQLPD
jgi:aminoglycoside phosphotransferase